LIFHRQNPTYHLLFPGASWPFSYSIASSVVLFWFNTFSSSLQAHRLPIKRVPVTENCMFIPLTTVCRGSFLALQPS
jgi:hypothetical protein